ncbi:ferredoxin Fer [Halorussus sp. MSC15.2]|uniref:ferredoxin Fer n=1 Tax=Halorussus sp. MSC15.2 TaxID=2283638 RepID=UPI0013D31DC5|nr:ferredoxin Fer [Halorussus sp. MSC15.2]NEU57987.1 2Fe-2S iron-sulfur cluster binding domain-containing protein [Halorussus sp. MSC15.2]
MESPFDVLRIDSDADDAEIEQAYRERVKEAHPDQGGSVAEFQAVRTAYERIKAGYRPDETTTEGDRAPSPGSAENHDSAQDRGRARNRDPNRARNRDQTRNRARDPKVASEVTYLNYDVLTDFGWETDDEDLLRKAAAEDLDEVDYGQFEVQPGQSLLEAAEDHEHAWPFACRGGACANCAVMLLDGELSMPASHVLPSELMERGIRLSCNGMPVTAELTVVYNIKHMPELEDLLLPPDPFESAYSD